MSPISTLLSTGTAQAIGIAIAAGTTSSVDVTAWYLRRIAQYNDGQDGLNCVRSISPLALAAASQADAEIAAGQLRGPLHGVPYLLKDNVFTLDSSPASAGCQAISSFIPPYEAILVRRLRDAGAILLGKTNLTEFADFVSDTMPAEFSSAGGVVRNPLGLRYERGQGSSVGSASAVAARFCAFAIGTETQNSIQTPALHTSIVGFKPSVGRVNCHGIVPLVPSQDAPGVLALSVADAALVFQVMAGADNAATISSLQGLRIGIPRRFIADNVLTESREPAFARTLQSLVQAGAILIDPCDLPSAKELHEVRSSVFRTEFKASLNSLLEQLQPCGMRSMQDIIDWNRQHSEVIPYGQPLLEAANASPGIASPQYLADRQRDIALSLDDGIGAALKAGGADVLLAPMSAAAKCTGKAGAPVLAIPLGADADGLPFGVTVLSKPGEDAMVLQAGQLIESLIGLRMQPVPGMALGAHPYHGKASRC